MRINNKTKTLVQAKTAVTTLLKKYYINWNELTQNNALIAWQSLQGVWSGKKVPDASRWQKQIRKEWKRNIFTT